MINFDVWSDQYYQWSDRYARDVRFDSEKETICSITKASRLRKAHSWILDRAIQAVRKTRMQMRNKRRSWTKALSLDASAWWHTVNGIRTSVIRRAGQRVSRKLSSDSRNFGRNLPNQSGAFAPAGRPLIDECRGRRGAGSNTGDARCEHPGRSPPSRRLCSSTVK